MGRLVLFRRMSDAGAHEGVYGSMLSSLHGEATALTTLGLSLI